MVKQHNAKLTDIEKAARTALQDVAKTVLKRAKENAPKDDGDLRRSGKVRIDDLSVIVRFTAPHAWLQHERLDYKHDSGGAKYLERAVDEVGGPAAVVSATRARISRG